MKEAAGRPQDLEDLKVLRELKRKRGREVKPPSLAEERLPRPLDRRYRTPQD